MIYYACSSEKRDSRSPCGSVDRNPLRQAQYRHRQVAPLAGAWIEIYSKVRRVGIPACRSPCGSVDRNFVAPLMAFMMNWVAPLAGAWIEIPGNQPAVKHRHGRSPCGSVDRNIATGTAKDRTPMVAPLAGAWIEIYIFPQVRK